MEELIKEAENLYNQIDRIQLDLIKSHLDESEGQKAKATDEMETAMCNAFHLLKCILERKDNIVDLSEVFHSVTEEPDRTKDILIDSYTFGYYIPATMTFSDKKWSHCISHYAIKRWAYINDLLPKGGE